MAARVVSFSQTKVFSTFDIWNLSVQSTVIVNDKDHDMVNDDAIKLNRTGKYSTWDVSSIRTHPASDDVRKGNWDFLYSGPPTMREFSRGNPLTKSIEAKSIDPVLLMSSPVGKRKSVILNELLFTLHDKDRESRALRRWTEKHGRGMSADLTDTNSHVMDVAELENTRRRLSGFEHHCFSCDSMDHRNDISDLRRDSHRGPFYSSSSSGSNNDEDAAAINRTVQRKSLVMSQLSVQMKAPDRGSAVGSALDSWTTEALGKSTTSTSTHDYDDHVLLGNGGRYVGAGGDQVVPLVRRDSTRYDLLHGMDTALSEDGIGDVSALCSPARLSKNTATHTIGEESVTSADSAAGGGDHNMLGEGEAEEFEPKCPTAKALHTLIKITQEFVSTEESFVADTQRLRLFLSELRYSALGGVVSFVASAPYVGVHTATEAIVISNTQFLRNLLKVVETCGNLKSESIQDTLLYASDLCSGVVDVVEQFSPFFALFSQFIIHHDAFSLTYSMLSFEDPSFSAYLSACERAIGETMLSLTIKPVQRLPRYVLLCKEIHSAVGKLHRKFEGMREDDDVESNMLCEEGGDREVVFAILKSLDDKSRAVHGLLSACAQECNNAIRVHQDNLRMHELYRLFVIGGTDIKAAEFLSRNRRIVKEGTLKRHHRRGTKVIRTHEIQLFSDMLYSSSQVGRGLKLEQQISLLKGSDTLCIPIPSTSPHSESAWFVVVSSEKTLFFCCRSQDDMSRWVAAIQSCLLENQTESDFYLIKNHVALVNTMVGEINRRLADLRITYSDEMNATTDQSSKVTDVSVSFLQSCWWLLVDALEAVSLKDALVESEDGLLEHNLRRVVEQHVIDVASRIVLSIDCQEESLLGSRSVIDDILGDDTLHYLIAVGVLFEYPQSVDASSSVDSGERPLLVKLFLMHDVVIGTILDKSKDSLKYYFHINVCDLECSGGGLAAILLVNKAARPMVRRRTLFERSGSSGNIIHSSGTKLLHAPTTAVKAQWLSLLNNVVGQAKRNNCESMHKKTADTPELYGRDYLLSVQLKRVARELQQPAAPSWIIEPPRIDTDRLS